MKNKIIHPVRHSDIPKLLGMNARRGSKTKMSNGVKLAVIKTGGKQYLIKEKDKIKIEKVKPAYAKASAGEKSKDVSFTEVLLIADDKKVEIGTPLIKNAKVIGKILKQGRGDKVIIFKYKPKKRYQKKAGHRQLFTEIEIKEILFPPKQGLA